MGTTVSTLPLARQSFYDANGNPLAGGSVGHYTPGTLTPVTTYSDYLGTVPNANPLTLDSSGGCEIYGNGSIRQIVKDSSGNTIYDQVVAFASANPTIGSIATLQALTGALVVNQCYVTGYASAGDGGEGMFTYVSSDTTSSDNGGTIIVDGANRRWYRQTNGGPISVKWFGAKGNNSTDDTTAIRQAAAAAVGGNLSFPAPATYIVSGTITCASSIRISGGAFSAGGSTVGAVIKTSSATADVFNMSGTFSEICGLAFASSVTRTAGAFIHITSSGGYADIHDVYMTGFYYGVQMDGNVLRLSDSFLLGGASTSAIGALINAGDDIVLRDLLIEGTSGQNLAAGVRIVTCGDCLLDHVQTIWAGSGCSIAPGSTQIVQYAVIDDCLFDTGTGNGIDVEATGTVQALKIANTWIASNSGHGIALNTSGSGAVQQTDIFNTISSNNTLDGLILNSANVSNTTVIGSSFSANVQSGILVAGSVVKFKILGCDCGASGEFAGNSQYGIVIGSGCDQFQVGDNYLGGNSVGSLNSSTSTPTWGVSAWVRDNIGFVNRNSGQLTTTAGPTSFAVTHGLNTTPALQDIVLTPLSGLGTAASYYATSAGASTFTIAFNAAPGAGVVIGWVVRAMGA